MRTFFFLFFLALLHNKAPVEKGIHPFVKPPNLTSYDKITNDEHGDSGGELLIGRYIAYPTNSRATTF